MNEEELKELTEKFPSVLKQALKEGVVDIHSFEPRVNLDGIPLFRGVRRRPGEGISELFESDFYSQAELFNHIQKNKLAESESKEYDVPADLKTQIELLKNTPRYKNYTDVPENYSCSLFKEYGKLDTFIGKADKGKFVVKGFVTKEQGFLSEQNGGPEHVHAFLFESANIKDSFEVTDGNS